jgi:hypothetical protein
MGFRDSWPITADGRDYDGRNLLWLIRDGRSPFADRWDVNLLIREIEDKLATQVVDIPTITIGSNNYVSLSTPVAAVKSGTLSPGFSLQAVQPTGCASSSGTR